MRGVSWEWDDPTHPSYRPRRQMGVIAQELREVFPDLVREGPDGFLTVDYAGLLAPVIAGKRFAVRSHDACRSSTFGQEKTAVACA